MANFQIHTFNKAVQYDVEADFYELVDGYFHFKTRAASNDDRGDQVLAIVKDHVSRIELVKNG